MTQCRHLCHQRLFLLSLWVNLILSLTNRPLHVYSVKALYGSEFCITRYLSDNTIYVARLQALMLIWHAYWQKPGNLKFNLYKSHVKIGLTYYRMVRWICFWQQLSIAVNLMLVLNLAKVIDLAHK